MNILVVLTYYRPHVSGLTIYVERLATQLAKRGNKVTVLTSHYSPDLPAEEWLHGVHVRRIPVAAHISKGVLMPRLGRVAHELAREHDVLSIHLPQFDAPGLSVHARMLGKPAILTYHCDLKLPMGIFNRVVDRVVSTANVWGARLADKIVTYTQDYADHSPLLSRFKDKIVVIPPPVVMDEPEPEAVAGFRQEHVLGDGPVIGFAARFAAEKGVEYLLDALPVILRRFPNAKVLFAGPYENVVGEATYWQRLEPRIRALGPHWEFLGTLNPAEMPPFMGACDLLVVPSLNSTESFGLVQVEAMLCGTPVVASDLPGVRQPVTMTGMGRIAPPADATGLSEAVCDVLARRPEFVRPRAEIAARFDVERTVDAYEALFTSEVLRRKETSSV